MHTTVSAVRKPSSWRDYDLVFSWVQPSPPPPAEGAVGDDEVLTLGYQPHIRIGHGIALIVSHQCDLRIRQGNACAGGFRSVGEDEVMRRRSKTLHCCDSAGVVIVWGVVDARGVRFIEKAHMHRHTVADALGHGWIGSIGWQFDLQFLADGAHHILEVILALPVTLQKHRAPRLVVQ